MLHRHATMVPLLVPAPSDLHAVEVLYLVKYNSSTAWSHPCCYIQHVRERKVYVYDYEDPDLRLRMRAQEEEYYASLDRIRSDFASSVLAAEPSIDLIVDPPSNSHLHRPYLSSIRNRVPEIDSMCFVKHDHTSSSVSGTTVDDLSRSMKPRASPEIDSRIKDKQCIVVVDDAFATGKTAAAIVQCLKRRITAPQARFLIACPLLVDQS